MTPAVAPVRAPVQVERPADLTTPVALMRALLGRKEPCFLLESVEGGEFDIVRVLTAGGPVDQTHVFATWAFKIGIEGNDIPLGACVSLFMLPILGAAAAFILRDVNRRVAPG